MQWFSRPYQRDELALYANELAGGHLAAVFGHAGYLINLAAQPSENRDRSVKSLAQELRLATDLGLPFLVLHPGAHLGKGEEEGIEQAARGVDEVFAAVGACPVRIALENTAGQGSCLGARLEHLAEMFQRVKQPERLGVCIDTAHLFAAGHDLRTRPGWDGIMKGLDSLVGLKQVLAFHLNDSKTPLGSRVDRHAHIGQGEIGLEAFEHIVNDPRFKDHPGCLETPKSADLHEDVENLAVLRALVRGGGVPAS